MTQSLTRLRLRGRGSGNVELQIGFFKMVELVLPGTNLFSTKLPKQQWILNISKFKIQSFLS